MQTFLTITALILAAVLGAALGAIKILLQMLTAEREHGQRQSADYERRDLINRDLAVGAMDRRYLLDGTVPLSEPLEPSDEIPASQPESIDDIRRLLREDSGGLTAMGASSKIANRRQLIMQLRDLEDQKAEGQGRTIPQPMPHDPTRDVQM